MANDTTVDVVRIHRDDNVVVAARGLSAGMGVDADGQWVKVREAVAMGHKVAMWAIGQGEAIIKYGQTIGNATQDIAPGACVHEHNLALIEEDKQYALATETPADPPAIEGRSFMGYRRADGRVGTRNYIAVISSVNCSASVSKYVAERFAGDALRDYPNVDGVFSITHNSGCGMAYGSDHHDQLNRVLTGFARHPNVAGYLLIGLGCEVGTMSRLVESGNLVQLASADRNEPLTLSMQECGGTVRTVAEGVRLVSEMLPRANDVKREPIPAAELLVGNECGGSDGNSGVTANPALGAAADMIVAAGGTAMISETCEIYGAEHLLARRALTVDVGQKLVDLIGWWKRYAAQFNTTMDANPTPGNKAGGITTIYEKSLGAVAKGGTTALRDVYSYAEPVTASGFVVMNSPGYDPASITGMVAGGANLICFTTGRGSCYGCKPAPTIKIATNTPMYEHMIDDMDLNAGVILEGTPVEEVGRQIFELILEVAGGRKTKSEQHGIGEEEFVPWHLGPML